MKFLCLAYGDEAAWKALSKREQDELLAQDQILRGRGDVVAAVQPAATTVQAWDGKATTASRAFSESPLPLAGFGIIEAVDLKEAIRLVSRTPCARAKGVVELRAITAINI